MSTCKRRVWVTMCEQADGSRTGKYNGFRYSSVPKEEAKPVKKKIATKAKPVKKTGTAPKKKTATKVAVKKTATKTATTKATKPYAVLAAAVYKKLGKEISNKAEMSMAMCLDWRWMGAREAKAVVDVLLEKGVVERKSGYIIPTRETRNTAVPTGYKPNAGALLKGAGA